MATTVSDRTFPSVLQVISTGRAGPVLRRFPLPGPLETAAADAAIDDVRRLLDEHLDAEDLDRTRQLPDGLYARLQGQGLLRLTVPGELGGRGLTPHATFRVIEAAAAHSVVAGQILGIQHGVGVTALLPAISASPLRRLLQRRIADGVVSGFADTDQAGQNNARPSLVATAVEGGDAYHLTGDKLYVGNGSVADLLGVSATVSDGGTTRVGVFFVDTSSPGFSVTHDVGFAGSAGLPNAALRFDAVHVHREMVLLDPDGEGLPPLVGMAAVLGRLYFTAAPALAIARRCLAWTTEFLGRRSIDGRPLVEYDDVSRSVSASLADVYLMDSVARWVLAGPDITDRWGDRLLAKNVLVRGCWRVVERTMSLFGAEGFETLTSKIGRGAPRIPLERAFRDARGLRIAGNVDDRLDHQAGALLLDNWYDQPDGASEPDDVGGTLGVQLAEYRSRCAALRARHPEGPAAPDRQHAVTLLGRAAGELLGLVALAARAGLPVGADPAAAAGELDALAVLEINKRLTALWHEYETADVADRGGPARRWLAAPDPDLTQP